MGIKTKAITTQSNGSESVEQTNDRHAGKINEFTKGLLAADLIKISTAPHLEKFRLFVVITYITYKT